MHFLNGGGRAGSKVSLLSPERKRRKGGRKKKKRGGLVPFHTIRRLDGGKEKRRTEKRIRNRGKKGKEGKNLFSRQGGNLSPTKSEPQLSDRRGKREKG